MNYLEQINIEYENDDKKDFECLVIKQGSISHLPYEDLDYVNKLLSLNLCETITINTENFTQFISEKLEISKYDKDCVFVKNEVIGEEPYYTYEMLYVDFDKKSEHIKDENINEFATLININGEKVYSTAIIFKTHLPSLSKSMYLKDMKKEDLKRIFLDRIYTKVVVYDSNWREETVVGDLNIFAERFFDGEKIEKIEIPFLMHNINIWYNTCKYSGRYDICGKIIDERVENCIWFTMKSDEYRGNLTLDEVNKIIHLSKLLDTYKTPERFYKEEYDKFGRRVIFNKYKVLDYMYKYPIVEEPQPIIENVDNNNVLENVDNTNVNQDNTNVNQDNTNVNQESQPVVNEDNNTNVNEDNNTNVNEDNNKSLIV